MDQATHNKIVSFIWDIADDGVIDVLRKGIEHGPVQFDLFYWTPSKGNVKAAALHAQNRFSVTRQLAYSMDETRRALDLCLFVNGLPIATFELKNSLTKQTVQDAVEQYRRDRDPRERLFEFGRCVVHFAVDDSEVQMCTELKGKGSWFLPFNTGYNDGAGNPPIRRASRLSTSGKRSLLRRALPILLGTTHKSSKRKISVRARRSDSRCGRATTNSGWYGKHCEMLRAKAPASGTLFSIRLVVVSQTRSPGCLIS
jgi:hypothetical protein